MYRQLYPKRVVELSVIRMKIAHIVQSNYTLVVVASQDGMSRVRLLLPVNVCRLVCSFLINDVSKKIGRVKIPLVRLPTTTMINLGQAQSCILQ